MSAAVAASLPSAANATPERHIPRGELTPQLIEKAFDSPRGEVQFTVVESTGNRSGYMRNNKGNVMAFTEVRGGRDCEEWFESTKTDAAPRGCEFLFYDQVDGRYMSVRSDELEESSIFDVTSEALQAHIMRPQSRLLLTPDTENRAPGPENGGRHVSL